MGHFNYTTVPPLWVEDEDDDAELVAAVTDALQGAVDLGEEVQAYANAVPGAGDVLLSRYNRYMNSVIDQLRRVLGR